MKQVDVRYRHQAATAKPLYVNNNEVRGVAGHVRGQLLAAADAYRLASEALLAIETIRANDVRLDVCWSTDYPVTNERGEPVLGVCEYDHRGMPDTALISVNPDLTRDNDGLLLGTLAHELGHAIFDVPGWRTMSCQTGLFGLADEPIHRVFRLVTVSEEQLSAPVRKAGERDFCELLVPRDLLAARLRHHAQALGLPLEGDPELGLMLFPERVFRIAADVDRGRYGFKIAILLSNLAEDFGVSPRFIEVRLVRYGLATDAQLALG